ncbi:putative cytochrome 83B1-like [Capsicum annuum]|nr:putative cytochrome 83B1-like [Capsicum annuum]KAF3682473.1 putative cytochrome 83B1-like [Capsicum annuum]
MGNDSHDKESKSHEESPEETRETIGNKVIVNEVDIPNISYFEEVIKETFRLHPPAPLLLPRESMGKSTLEGYEIPPRTIIHVNSWEIRRDYKIWENPKKFIPARFLNSNIDFKEETMS